MVLNNTLNNFTHKLRNANINQLSGHILERKQAFQNYWHTYKQVYMFNEIPCSISDNFNFHKMNGHQLVENLKYLPFDVFMIKLSDANRKYLNCIFRSNRVHMDSYIEDKILIVSCFIVQNHLCLFFSPTDIKGNMSKKSFVLKMDLDAPVEYSLSRFDSELAGLKYGKNRVSSDKLAYANCIKNAAKHLIYHLLYLSMCYKRVIPQNINYITSCVTYNTVNNYGVVAKTNNDDIKTKTIIKNAVKHYQNNDLANGSSKTTHSRRGHEHRFWIGSGEDKKLITKWVKPTIVNEGKDNLQTLVTHII